MVIYISTMLLGLLAGKTDAAYLLVRVVAGVITVLWASKGG